jgi:hypothetical protein
VTFSLSGFSVDRREGIELATNFTANGNAELRVGALEETITVSGQSPTADVQNVIQQRVLNAEVVDTGRSRASLIRSRSSIGRTTAAAAARATRSTVRNAAPAGIPSTMRKEESDPFPVIVAQHPSPALRQLVASLRDLAHLEQPFVMLETSVAGTPYLGEITFDQAIAGVLGRARTDLHGSGVRDHGCLPERAGTVVTRDELLHLVWGDADTPMTRTVDNFVFRLRHNIEPDPHHPRYIRTACGDGYRLTLAG